MSLDDLLATYDASPPPMQIFAELMALPLIGAMTEVGHHFISPQLVDTLQVMAEFERALSLEECPPAELTALAARNVSEGTALALVGLAAMVRRRDRVTFASALPMTERPTRFATGGDLLHDQDCTRRSDLEMLTVTRMSDLVDAEALPLPCSCILDDQ